MRFSLKRGASVMAMTSSILVLGAVGVGTTAAHAADVGSLIQQASSSAPDPCPPGYAGVIVGTHPGHPDEYLFLCVKL